MSVGAIRKSSLLSVACRGHDPEPARRATELYIERCLDHHRGLNRNPAAHDFFAKQAELLREQLRESEAQLLAIKNQVGVVSIAEQKRLLLTRADALAADVQTTEAAIEETEAAICELQKQLDTVPQRLVMQITVAHSNLSANNMH